jgi:hypothetical protein
MLGLRKGYYQRRNAFCKEVFEMEDEGGTFIKGGLMFYLIVYYNDFCGSVKGVKWSGKNVKEEMMC